MYKAENLFSLSLLPPLFSNQDTAPSSFHIATDSVIRDLQPDAVAGVNVVKQSKYIGLKAPFRPQLVKGQDLQLPKVQSLQMANGLQVLIRKGGIQLPAQKTGSSSSILPGPDWLT